MNALLDGIKALDAEGKTREASRRAMTYVEDYLSRREFTPVDALLSHLVAHAEDYSPHVLVGLVRCTFRAGLHLPHWFRALRAVRRALEAKGLDANALLQGLDTA